MDNPTKTDVGEIEFDDRFWLIVHKPGCIPERKGSWKWAHLATVLREFIAANPTAYLHVLSLDAEGKPQIDHGPECLQIADGRSMITGSKHNARTKAAHSALLTSQQSEITRLTQEVEALRDGLSAIDELCTDEIKARFGGQSSMSIEQCARNSKVYSLLVVPRNLARATLTGHPTKDPGNAD